MALAKITVVGQAPFPITLDDGQVAPGESRRVERSPLVELHLETAALRENDPEEAEPARKTSRSDDSTPKENS